VNHQLSRTIDHELGYERDGDRQEHDDGGGETNLGSHR
jgi:hypothetical protein